LAQKKDLLRLGWPKLQKVLVVELWRPSRWPGVPRGLPCWRPSRTLGRV